MKLVLVSVVLATMFASCATKKCPKPFNGFTVYERPGPIEVTGEYTLVDLEKALKAVAIKSRVQSAIIDNYERDIKRYNDFWKKAK